MQRINKATAEAIIDFSGGNRELASLAEQQLQGAVALFNKLSDQRVAYLADEVGMGKTYIGLGVVGLMRHFNPGLRVLYLLPKNNVRDKWIKDYRAFVHSNFRLRDLAVKGLGNQPVAPYRACHNLSELVQSISSGNERDFFVCTSAFSFALGNTIADMRRWLKRLEALIPLQKAGVATLVKAMKPLDGRASAGSFKAKVKVLWMQALGDILPRFDLVVVDEAHNLRGGSESSDRNRFLAALLGQQKRINRLLLLSATPYDRHLGQLRNQLSLFGFLERTGLSEGDDPAQPNVHAALSRLMVRRLNHVVLDDKPHTRNMYRREQRFGESVEVKMTVAQKLFAALLQKKVSEHLQENFSNRFELGMLASFESYLPGDKNLPVEFDGAEAAGDSAQPKDAADRGIVEYLVRDFERVMGKSPPHPKMDSVSEKTHRLAFVEGQKQLVFVRRVRSVSELKLKLEEAYDDWLRGYVEGDSAIVESYEVYLRGRLERRSHSLADADPDMIDGPVSSDNFFSWFYRGQNPDLTSITGLGQLPHNFRNTLLQSRLFETNWTSLPGMPSVEAVCIEWNEIGKTASVSTPAQRYRLAQYLYLTAVARNGGSASKVAKCVLEVLFEGYTPACELPEPHVLECELERSTLWDELRANGLAELAPEWNHKTFGGLAAANHASADRLLRKQSTHQELLGAICRVDHPFIDLYSLRQVRRDRESDSDGQLIAAWVKLLAKQQAQGTPFCSFQILRDTAVNLELLIKLNFPLVYSKPISELTQYLASKVRYTSPIRGATGENSGSRTAIATLFRMPGYPRVLVSTDVFQEGEDLHTFCDSVVHYGISSSPIALEQKVGRVDRIGSLAHRRMRSAKSQLCGAFYPGQLPHIRESLEFYQVRQAALSMNAFIRTLHAVGKGVPQSRSGLDEGQEVVNVAPIQPQILDLLTSHYDIGGADLQGDDHTQAIALQMSIIDQRLDHVREQLGTVLRSITDDPQAHVREAGDGWHASTNDLDGLRLTVRSVVGMAELLLSAELSGESDELEDIASPTERVRYLQVLQSDPFRRVSLGSTANEVSQPSLRYNAESYAGSDGILVRDEIFNIRQRALGQGRLSGKHAAQATIHGLVGGLAQDNERIRVKRLSAWRFEFYFKLEGRTQLVEWKFNGQYVVFTSVVLDYLATRRLAKHKHFQQSPLVLHTLQRNHRFDLVDFHVDSGERLAVRAAHPVQHLNAEELAFIAHQVASQADRLEHVLLGPDGAINSDD